MMDDATTEIFCFCTNLSEVIVMQNMCHHPASILSHARMLDPDDDDLGQH